MSKPKRVCLIGAGPSGMSFLYHFHQLKEQGKEIPEIVCFDKQSDWGGLWFYSWETGTNQYGESVHGSMYKGLFANLPKECVEFPDYTFQDHFKRPIPSFPPREVLYDYLKGRWSKGDLRQWIQFNHVVRHVTYNDGTDDFTVKVKNLPEDKDLPAQRFDYVIVATGHFSVPCMPYFNGIESFPGRVIHSHDFRNALQFKDETILIIGAKYSAEDIAVQNIKFGAKKVIISYRTKPMGVDWPPEIEERPLVTKVDGNTIHFQDGSSADVDSIILCTGYIHHYPFLEERLRLKSLNNYYPGGVYKGIVWNNSANNKLLYIGKQDQIYTFTMFDVQAKWAVNYICGDIKLPDKKTMEADMTKWVQRKNGLKNIFDVIDFQTDYVCDLSNESNYGYDLDVTKIFRDLVPQKCSGILTFRDHCHVSKFTGVKSPIHHSKFMDAFDDSMETFINAKQ